MLNHLFRICSECSSGQVVSASHLFLEAFQNPTLTPPRKLNEMFAHSSPCVRAVQGGWASGLLPWSEYSVSFPFYDFCFGPQTITWIY